MQCGTCYSFCPKDNITFNCLENYVFEFKIKNPSLCHGCGICYKVCPGHGVDFTELNSYVFSLPAPNNLIGNFLKCYLSQSTDKIIRTTGASGGTVSALLTFGLKQKIFDGALVVKMSDSDPLEPEVFIARNKEEILLAAQSKYRPVAMNIGLRNIMESEGKFAVVGLPCHIHGLRKAELLFPQLKEKIVLRIGLLCGPGPSFLMTDHLLRKEKIRKADVAGLKYREGEKWPGGMLISLKRGGKKFIPLKNYLYAQTVFNRYRCSICTDFACELADISLGDAHLPEFWRSEPVYLPDGRILKGEDGWNLTITRTFDGESILEKAYQAKVIELINISSKRAIETQKSILRYKKNTVFALFNLLKIINKTIPTYRGIKQTEQLGIHDYIKSIIVLLCEFIVNSKVGCFILANIPNRILRLKIGFRQRQINKYIKGKIS